MRAALIAAVLAAPVAALAHEVLHDVERGRAVAVRAYESDGEALADLEWEVYSPAAPAAPRQRGRTDPAGWLAFVPDAPGAWRVRVVDPSGHGLDATVDVGPGGLVAPSRGAGGAAFVLRPLLGVAAVAAIFAALVVRARRRSART